MERFNQVKVFSVVDASARQTLGDEINRWIGEQGDRIEIVDKAVIQSSDNEYHCLTIILFCRRRDTETSPIMS